VSTSEPLQELLAAEPSLSAAVERIPVEPLPSEDAIELARACLGDDPDLEAQAIAVAGESRGSPLLVGELARHAAAGGRIQTDSGVMLRDLLRHRIQGLDAGARRLVEVLAVAGRPLEIDVALRAAMLAEDSYTALSAVRAGHLARSRSDRRHEWIEPFHDRTRETILDTLDGPALREHHARIALELERWGRADPETLAIHFRAAGDASSALAYAVRAASQAEEALAFVRAARLYRMALRLNPPDRQKIDLRVKLAMTLTNAGRGYEAAREYLDAARASPAAALELQRRAAEELLRSGHVDEGLRVLHATMEAVGLHPPRTTRAALRSLVLQRVLTRLRGLRFRERSELDVAPNVLRRIDICYSGALGLGMTDFIRGAQLQTTHLLLALRAGEMRRVVRALACEAVYSATIGSRARARTERVIAVANALADRLGDPYAVGYAKAGSGMAIYLLGDRKEAFDLCAVGAEIFMTATVKMSWSWEVTTANLFMLWSLFFLGELRELAERVPVLLDDALNRGDLYAATVMRVGHCNVAWLALDDVEQARRHEREAIDQWSRLDYHLQHYHHLLAQVQIDLYVGDTGAAWKRISSTWPALHRSFLLRNQDIRIEALFQRARSALAVAETASDPEPLLRAAERDGRHLIAERVAWGTGFGHQTLAAVARRRGRDDEAVTLLEHAEASYASANMMLFGAVAAARRGAIVGGERGSALVRSADVAMAAQQIRNPARMMALLAPGFDGAP
jgi:tetratricopeptide (TPR) repeat protein